MPKYQSDVATGKKAVPQPFDATVITVPVDLSFPTVALVANDLLELLEVPPSVQVVGVEIIAPQLDSNAAPTLAFSLGALNAAGTDLATVYEAGLKPGAGAAGSVALANGAALAFANRSAARKLALKVTTAAATSATAGKQLLALVRLRH
ncbi:MAG: hypothetical protein LBJ15_16320 [Comamonas sp.]|jgi:hypothetical protein|uniref:hypothetical protein n=1 Tax=Comamonas sp. TaxID=34028 RepID=UPI002834C44A|nr:hypothetical protein [Comamonas sp.]MDR0215548.1 hypothetical protein [Comamonas sp.]